jgi:hypothetical protein
VGPYRLAPRLPRRNPTPQPLARRGGANGKEARLVQASTSEPAAEYSVELDGESGGRCDCCGRASHSVWGWVHRDERTVASYRIHWTVGHLSDLGANFDLVLGTWGENTTVDDRFAASLLYREPDDSPSAFMVIDADDRSIEGSELCSSALQRDEIIGTPLAEQLFAIIDAIWVQDCRFF